MKHRYVLALVLCAVLAGCATLGIEAPKTLPDRIAYATSTADGLVVSTTNALNAHTIGSADAAYVSRTAKETSLLLGAATTDSDPKSAEGRVQLAESVLRNLQSYLAAKGAK